MKPHTVCSYAADMLSLRLTSVILLLLLLTSLLLLLLLLVPQV